MARAKFRLAAPICSPTVHGGGGGTAKESTNEATATPSLCTPVQRLLLAPKDICGQQRIRLEIVRIPRVGVDDAETALQEPSTPSLPVWCAQHGHAAYHSRSLRLQFQYSTTDRQDDTIWHLLARHRKRGTSAHSQRQPLVLGPTHTSYVLHTSSYHPLLSPRTHLHRRCSRLSVKVDRCHFRADKFPLLCQCRISSRPRLLHLDPLVGPTQLRRQANRRLGKSPQGRPCRHRGKCLLSTLRYDRRRHTARVCPRICSMQRPSQRPSRKVVQGIRR